jgi:arthrofactin-type cyclic lipopeptide synthetase B
VGRHDNFFELGGHSLLIVQMIERLRQVSISADAREIFLAPTLQVLAGAVRQGTKSATPANGVRFNEPIDTIELRI